MRKAPGLRRERVLVTDPEHRAALATVRALGRAGFSVYTSGTDRGIAGVSRSVQAHLGMSRADADSVERYPAAILSLVEQHGIDVVVPVTDAASRLLLPLKDRSGLTVAGPSMDAYERASNKELLMRMAPTVGIRVPGQVVLESVSDAEVMKPHWEGDSVIKPTRSVAVTDGRTVKASARYAATNDELAAAIRSYAPESYPLLVQERCPGQGTGVFLLRGHGRTLMVAAHRRLREKPPSGGASTYRETITPSPSLLGSCEELLKALDYEGPAMIEFKEDVDTGSRALMEINARLWGSLQLAVDAGADFPVALVEWALGQTPMFAQAVKGVRSVWEVGEIDHVLAIWRHTAKSLNLPHGSPVGMRAALAVLIDRRWSDRCEVFNWGDPRPFISETMSWLAALRTSASGSE